MTRHPVVLIAEELSPATVDALRPDVEVRHVDGSDRAALLPALADADAVLVRSATRVDREAVAAGPRLKVVARAEVGLDNVDIPAATEAGVLVANAPVSNVTSAAELTVGLLLTVARSIPQADAALKRFLAARPLVRRGTERQSARRRRPRPHRRPRRPAHRAAGGVHAQLEVLLRGEIAESAPGVLELAALKGVLDGTAASAVSHVNAPLVARERGLTSRLSTCRLAAGHRSALTLSDGRVISVTGTLAGIRLQERLVEALGHDLDLPLRGDLCFLRYPHRPGAIGAIGGEFAAEGVDIAAMQVSRGADRTALAGLCVDAPVPASALGRAAATVDADLTWHVPATD